MKTTQAELDSLKQTIEDRKGELDSLEREWLRLDKKFFTENCGKPLYDGRSFQQQPLSVREAHETEIEWMDTGTMCLNTRKPVSIWVCKFCKTPARRKYIATGHDHTDYSYEVCDCAGAAAQGKMYSELT